MVLSADQRSRKNVFAGLALDRCSERRGDNDWLQAVTADPAARFLVVSPDGRALTDAASSTLRFLDGSERACLPADTRVSFLGVDAGKRPYLLLTPQTVAATEVAATCAGAYLDLRRAGLALSAFEAGLFAYARGLAHWQSRSGWCGGCGSEMMMGWGGHRGRCSLRYCA